MYDPNHTQTFEGACMRACVHGHTSMQRSKNPFYIIQIF